MKRRIVFATGNENKMKEIRMILADLGMEIVSMREAGVDEEIVEDGMSFEENAEIKARAVSRVLVNDIVLADDSGLEIDYLDKAPGIYSARFAGEDTSYDIKNRILLDRLEGVPDDERTARFVCAVAAVFPDGTTSVVRETIEGQIGHEIVGANGFGYDPIFYVPEFGCTTAEMTPEQKNKLSHRGKALRAIKILLEIERGRSMKILIVSDTHGRHQALDRALEEAGKIDMFIHLGDVEGGEDYLEAVVECEKHIIRGNNDFFTELPREEEFEIGPYHAFITHGHYYYVSMGMETIIEEGRSRGADLVMFGHTHRPFFLQKDGMTILNPGSLSFPRQEGRRGSYMIMEVDGDGKLSFEQKYL